MNNNLLHPEVQAFISTHLNEDPHKILLKGSPFDGITSQELVTQIVAKKKSQKKLPTWFHTPKILFPPPLSIEQTSSEITAQYKANLVEGEVLIDLTGGFGVDSYYFAKKVHTVHHCEQKEVLSQIAQHNFGQLGTNNISCYAVDGIQFIQETSLDADWLYVDPSRRDNHKGKVFLLEDCEPNVVAHLSLLLSRAPNILLKTSPLFDIQKGLQVLEHVKEVHCVAVHNEMKELLWIVERGFSETPKIKTVNLQKDGTPQTFEENIPKRRMEN